MNWTRWKTGLAIAAMTGALSGLATLAIVDQVTLNLLLKVLVLTLGFTAKDALLWLKDHPAPDPEGGAVVTTPQAPGVPAAKV